MYIDGRITSRLLEITTHDAVLKDRILCHGGSESIVSTYREVLSDYPNDILLVHEVFDYLDSLEIRDAAISIMNIGLTEDDRIAYLLRDTTRMKKLLFLMYLIGDYNTVVLVLLEAIKGDSVARQEVIDYATNYPHEFIHEEVERGSITRNNTGEWRTNIGYITLFTNEIDSIAGKYFSLLMSAYTSGWKCPPMDRVLEYLRYDGSGKRIFTTAYISRQDLRELILSHKQVGMTSYSLLTLFLERGDIIVHRSTVIAIITTIVEVYELTYEGLWEEHNWRDYLK